MSDTLSDDAIDWLAREAEHSGQIEGWQRCRRYAAALRQQAARIARLEAALRDAIKELEHSGLYPDHPSIERARKAIET
jgi:hypothetical protein